MNFAMVTAAQRHSEFITHLAAERRTLREAHVMSIGWLTATDHARLLSNEPDVIAVTNPPRLWEGKDALVNFFGAPLPKRRDRIARGARLETLRPRCPLSRRRRRGLVSDIRGKRRD